MGFRVSLYGTPMSRAPIAVSRVVQQLRELGIESGGALLVLRSDYSEPAGRRLGPVVPSAGGSERK